MKYQFDHDKIKMCGDCPCFSTTCDDCNGECGFDFREINVFSKIPDDCPLCENNKQIGDWVSIDEYFPEEFTRCILCINPNNDPTIVFGSFYFGEWHTPDCIDNFIPTHWMKMPELPSDCQPGIIKKGE